MASARENDLNPDIFIGLKLPFNRDKSGLFGRTQTTLEQAGSNIKNLLLTAKGERVMQPDFGSRLRELLFEQYTEDLSSRIQDEIQEAISTWLPYINIKEIKAVRNINNYSVAIRIRYNITSALAERVIIVLANENEIILSEVDDVPLELVQTGVF